MTFEEWYAKYTEHVDQELNDFGKGDLEEAWKAAYEQGYDVGESVGYDHGYEFGRLV